MFNQKIRTCLWALYIIIYLWAWGAPHYWDNSYDFYVRLTISAIILIGMIGYIAKFKIAYKIIWKSLFLISLFIFSFSLIAAIIFEKSGILMLAVLLPALYALHAYAYRSNSIWDKNDNTNDK